ncbi:MAG: LysR family transcriptional regulator [Hyphomicrobiaceae bacterium]|nr:MAG: LysR family transcriptional regulator [Hyphomicrobiaceae bacterium]
MARLEPGWELYRSFLAALRAGSLSSAARSLKLTQPTIGRHIDELEATLDTMLFTRSQHGLQPTDAAMELAPYAETMASSASALIRAASGNSQEIRGAVRLSASEVVGVEVLPPMLASLHEQHPLLALELVVSNQVRDLLRRDVDLAVRNVRPTQTGLVAKKIGDVTLGLHAHRRYLKSHGTPRTIDDLKDHALIGYDQETPAVRSLQAKGMRFSRDMFALRTDNDLAHLAAIRAGYGIGICQVPIGLREPYLIRLLPRHFVFNLEIWLVMHENLRTSPRMRAVFDHLGSALSTYVDAERRRT